MQNFDKQQKKNTEIAFKQLEAQMSQAE